MPLFFMISGMLIAGSLRKKGLSSYLTARLNTIFYPLLVWGFLQISIYLLTERFTHNGITPEYYVYLIFDPRLTGHFWYLNALFWIGVIFALMKAKLKIKPFLHLFIGLVLFCISSYIHTQNIRAGVLTDICEYYVFFALGDLISDFALRSNNVGRYSSPKVFMPLFIVFLAVQYYCTKINLNPGNGIKMDEHFVEFNRPGLYMLEALTGVALSLNVSFLLQKYQTLNFLRVVGYHSLYIYCANIIALTFVRTIFLNVLHVHNVLLIFLPVWAAGILLPIIFYNFSLRYNLWWLFSFKIPGKQVAYLQKNNIFSPRFKPMQAGQADGDPVEK